jgi:DNA gyrase subunit A
VPAGEGVGSVAGDIDKDTVDFQENYDGSETEPTVLPARFPNLLVNGAGGIAVGMATNIPPHNLGEVIDACNRRDGQPGDQLRGAAWRSYRGRISRPAASFWAGPVSALPLETGRGSIIMRGKVEHRGSPQGPRGDHRSRDPYQVNKASMIEKIAELVRDKRIEGISDIRDESDRQGMRVVIEIRKR